MGFIMFAGTYAGREVVKKLSVVWFVRIIEIVMLLAAVLLILGII